MNIMRRLNERDRKVIMLYFGFYDGKAHTQQEIADMMSISKDVVFRIISSNINKLRSNTRKRQTTIYELFSDYTREEIDNVLKILPDDDIELIKLRYGNNLDNPVSVMNSDERLRYYNSLVPKIRRKLIRERKKVRINSTIIKRLVIVFFYVNYK